MAQQETRKQQIARRLRVSERVLEQYLQLKRAEVADESDAGLARTPGDSVSGRGVAVAEQRSDRKVGARGEWAEKRV